MANRYWVYTGVNRQWGSTNEGTWSATSGGAGNASVPTAADDVFFDANSGPAGQIVTFFNSVCRSLNTTGFLGSFAQGGSTLSISGNLVLTKNIPTPALSVRFLGTGSTFSINAGTNFLSSHNVQIGSGSAVSDYTLAADLTCSTFLLKATSTFSTSNFNINLTSSLGTETGSSFSPGTSTINCTVLNIPSNTWSNAQNSTINLAATNGLSNSGNSLGTVIVNPTATPCNIVGAGTYVNLTINYPNIPMTTSVSGTQTVTGTFTVNGTDLYPRIQNGTINAANVNLNKVLFSGFTGGGAATWTGNLIGAFGSGNSNNITFSTPVDAICTTSGEWFNSTTWNPRVPLPQDNAVVKTVGSNITLTNTASGGIYIKALEYQNVSGGTINMQSLGNINILDGGFNVPAGVTIGNNKPNLFFSSLNDAGSYTISCVPNLTTCIGVMRIWNTGATYTVTTSLSCSSSITHLTGNLILADNITFGANSYSTSGTTARSLSLGNNTIFNINGVNAAWDVSGSNFVFDCGTSAINFTSGTANNCTFNGADLTYYQVTFANSSPTLFITGNNTFKSFTANKVGTPYSIQFTSGSTNTFESFSVNGSAGNGNASIGPNSTAACNFVKTGSGVVSCNYLTVNKINATPSTNTWYAGGNSTDAGGNTGWVFLPAPTGFIANSLFFGSFF